MNDFKKKFIEILSDKEVKEKIKEINLELIKDVISRQKEYENNRLKEIQEQYKNEFARKENELSQVIHDMKSVRDENIRLSEQNKIYEQKIKENESILKDLKKIIEIKSAFNNLSESLKKSLSMFNSDDLESILVRGLQWENIKSLYDLLKNNILESDNKDDNENLKIIVYGLIEIYSKKDKEPRYVLATVEENMKYDSYTSTSVNNIHSGFIKKILLRGLYDNKMNKIIQKNLVEL